MKTIAVINVKGGVAKTTTTVTLAHILATQFNKRVLVVDNDKQGHASLGLGCRDEKKLSIAEVLLNQCKMTEAIQKTSYENLDVLQANMSLLTSMQQLLVRATMQSFTIYPNEFKMIKNNYDYCIIDNAPDVNIAVMNALHAADEIIVPIMLDQNSFDGFLQLEKQIQEARVYNSKLKFSGCLITRYCKDEADCLRDIDLEPYKIFPIRIRRSSKVANSSFKFKPIIEYSPRSATARDYIEFTKFYFGL